MCDKYAVIKGKALTMVREFHKVYPNAPIIDRVANEVLYAAHYEFPRAQEIDTEKLHKIIREIKEVV